MPVNNTVRMDISILPNTARIFIFTCRVRPWSDLRVFQASMGTANPRKRTLSRLPRRSSIRHRLHRHLRRLSTPPPIPTSKTYPSPRPRPSKSILPPRTPRQNRTRRRRVDTLRRHLRLKLPTLSSSRPISLTQRIKTPSSLTTPRPILNNPPLSRSTHRNTPSSRNSTNTNKHLRFPVCHTVWPLPVRNRIGTIR